MNLSATLANTAWLVSSLPAYVRFRHALGSPARTQQQILSRLLAKNRHTVFGQKHQFQQIKNYADFSQLVPLATYDDFNPWIERIRQGESNILTSETVRHLIPTSGSSGACKLIPFTAGLQREFNQALDPWLVDLVRKRPGLALGPAYWSISPATQFPQEDSAIPVEFATDSEYLGGVRRHLVESVFAAPAALRLVRDMESFRYLTLLCLLRCGDLRMISIWHPSFLTLLLDALPAWWDSLLNDMATGRSARLDALPPDIRNALLPRPYLSRAKQLSACDPASPEGLWPSLQVISCWGHSQSAPALAHLQTRFPNTFIQPKGLLATEAFVTIPYHDHHPLAICSHFFEFLGDCGKIYLAHELQNNAVYEVIVTTAGGLWRYRLGDLVKVTGFINQIPSLRFLGRAGNVSDLCGEKLSEAFVTQAIQTACNTLPTPPRFVLLAPEKNSENWHYTLYIEGDSSPELTATLEGQLRRNPHYAYCRDLDQLGPPRLFPITHGAYEAYTAAEMAAGRKLGDIKPLMLSRRTDWSGIFHPDPLPICQTRQIITTAPA